MNLEQNSRTFRLALEAHDVPAFKEAMHQAGYGVTDTEERVTTDAGVDAEHVLQVTVPASACRTEAQRVRDLIRV